MTTDSREYLRGLTEIRELQEIMSNSYLRHFFATFVSKANQIFQDFQLASVAILEQTASYMLIFFLKKNTDDPIIAELTGVKTLVRVLQRNKRTVNLSRDIKRVMHFIEAIPDRETVVMQVARHLALGTPFKDFITGKHRPQSMMPPLSENDNRDASNPYVIIDLFATKLIEEWVGSVCNAFGESITTSVKSALDDDVIAQVRPSNAARLIVNCVWGLDFVCILGSCNIAAPKKQKQSKMRVNCLLILSNETNFLGRESKCSQKTHDINSQNKQKKKKEKINC
ncbi:hypothetical protein RFI_19798 [Reticulomyxa filosa]|uniref:Uncharacterized protein n=1 Tax=Reticulomyxa filosa TaxID=46433 RepID=X6MUM6_RETFI|nr:hypothetical protein RFI_19798 [Reticulomyxa filosa]|eukprot:ETO17524.1 hypothetical protein RFI_19798 [Reticulomyxa filosa]